jgi:hypothetical protein
MANTVDAFKTGFPILITILVGIATGLITSHAVSIAIALIPALLAIFLVVGLICAIMFSKKSSDERKKGVELEKLYDERERTILRNIELIDKLQIDDEVKQARKKSELAKLDKIKEEREKLQQKRLERKAKKKK